MRYRKTDFVPFSADAQRSIANLEAGYAQLVDIERELDAMPTSMFWQSKNGKDYLAVKKSTSDSGTTQGLRSPETERQFAEYSAERERLQVRRASLSALVQDRVKLCRALRLPQLQSSKVACCALSICRVCCAMTCWSSAPTHSLPMRWSAVRGSRWVTRRLRTSTWPGAEAPGSRWRPSRHPHPNKQPAAGHP